MVFLWQTPRREEGMGRDQRGFPATSGGLAMRPLRQARVVRNQKDFVTFIRIPAVMGLGGRIMARVSWFLGLVSGTPDRGSRH
jgi:hypothetical protein